jgi:hypothetical protein
MSGKVAQRESTLSEVLIWSGIILLALPLLLYLLFRLVDYFYPMPPFEG